jgi:TM2 domain-containing membrane protein YozV
MRSRTTAALLALFGGVFGMHFFYLGRIGLGIMSVIFTFSVGLAPVAAIIGFVNFLILLGMSDAEFMKRYNRDQWRDSKRKQYQEENHEQWQREEEERRRKYEQNREARERMRPTPQSMAAVRPDVSQKENLKQSGLKKYKEFDYDGAIEDFGKTIALDNKDIAVHWNLACLYSLTEQKELAFYHLQIATELGYKDYEKIRTHDALSYLRVQPEFMEFAQNNFRMTESMEHSDILQQLKDLTAKRAKGLLTEREFAERAKELRS